MFNEFIPWLEYVKSLPNYSKDTYSLDRVHNDFGYEPMNLRWASKSEQSDNRRVKPGAYTSFDKRRNTYSARFIYEREMHHVGTFSTREEAVMAVNDYIIKNNINKKQSRI